MKTLSDAEQDMVFYIGQTADNEFNIYKGKRTEIDGLKFETWMAARRYLRAGLEAKRLEVMGELFNVDKAIRRASKLKETHCRPLNIVEAKTEVTDAAHPNL